MYYGFGDSVGIFIPCEDLQSLKCLILELYKKKILTDENYMCCNVPENFLEIMNDPTYFDTVELCGFVARKRELKKLDMKTEEML